MRFFASLRMTISKSFFKVSPILKFILKEESMIPLAYPGDIALVEKVSYKFNPSKKGDLIVFKDSEGKYFLKKISKTSKNKIFVLGENKEKSKDSRHFGWIEKKDIIGKVFYILRQ